MLKQFIEKMENASFLFLGFLHFLIDTNRSFFELFVCVGSKSWHRSIISVLDFSNINCVFLEFCEYSCHSILEPQSISFKFNTLKKKLVMLDSISEFSTRFCSFSIYCIDHIVGTFIAESHSNSKLKIKNSKHVCIQFAKVSI